MRNELTRERLLELMRELARSAPPEGGRRRVCLMGGATAVWSEWRESSIDADMFTESEELLRDVQGMKERLNINIELARPEQFVPPLPGADGRHVFITTMGSVDFHHYDPYSQLFSKIVRGFTRDHADARHFLSSGMVDADRFRVLVDELPDSAFTRYPRLSPRAVREAVKDFLDAEAS